MIESLNDLMPLLNPLLGVIANDAEITCLGIMTYIAEVPGELAPMCTLAADVA